MLLNTFRRPDVLEVIDPSWSSYATEEFAGARDSLFGEAFQADLTERVEKDTALAKAVSITKKQKKESEQMSMVLIILYCKAMQVLT